MDERTATQRDYYTRTAEHYEAMHVVPDDEHGVAISAFVGIAHLKEATSVLDVGAGTGRALLKLRQHMEGARLVGVEPVAALREVAYNHGIARDQLIEGDATRLPFADNSFDFVIETGALHHIAQPAKAVAEMVRVARLGVMISDSNKFGQGSALLRWVKSSIRALGIWEAFIWMQTRGKMFKWSEEDGLFYSYSVFDSIEQLRSKFPRLLMMNTTDMAGTDLRSGAPAVMTIALKS